MQLYELLKKSHPSKRRKDVEFIVYVYPKINHIMVKLLVIVIVGNI